MCVSISTISQLPHGHYISYTILRLATLRNCKQGKKLLQKIAHIFFLLISLTLHKKATRTLWEMLHWVISVRSFMTKKALWVNKPHEFYIENIDSLRHPQSVIINYIRFGIPIKVTLAFLLFKAKKILKITMRNREAKPPKECCSTLCWLT